MGVITELATAAPGYNSIRPNTCAPLAQTLLLNGYSTAQFGKCHEVPVWQTSRWARFDAWRVFAGRLATVLRAIWNNHPANVPSPREASNLFERSGERPLLAMSSQVDSSRIRQPRVAEDTIEVAVVQGEKRLRLFPCPPPPEPRRGRSYGRANGGASTSALSSMTYSSSTVLSMPM
jgi:arylsulfatase A-like enzyme